MVWQQGGGKNFIKRQSLHKNSHDVNTTFFQWNELNLNKFDLFVNSIKLSMFAFFGFYFQSKIIAHCLRLF